MGCFVSKPSTTGHRYDYHLGAAVVGDPISSPARLVAAGQTVHDVRTVLKHGRGNVAADTAPSNGHNGIGSSVTESGMDRYNKLALAASMGAAVCDWHAGLAAVMHAPHMADDERSVNVGAQVRLDEMSTGGRAVATRGGHAWNELRRGAGGRDGRATIVMDAWANGPAVRLQNSAWRKASIQNESMSLNKDDAAWAKDRVEVLAPMVHPDEDDQTVRKLNNKRNNPTQWEHYAEAQVVSTKFASKARDQLSALPPARQWQLAAGVVREAYGMDERAPGQRDAVASVLDTAQRLDALSRPQIVAPDY